MKYKEEEERKKEGKGDAKKAKGENEGKGWDGIWGGDWKKKGERVGRRKEDSEGEKKDSEVEVIC